MSCVWLIWWKLLPFICFRDGVIISILDKDECFNYKKRKVGHENMAKTKQYTSRIIQDFINWILTFEIGMDWPCRHFLLNFLPSTITWHPLLFPIVTPCWYSILPSPSLLFLLLWECGYGDGVVVWSENLFSFLFRVCFWPLPSYFILKALLTTLNTIENCS